MTFIVLLIIGITLSIKRDTKQSAAIFTILLLVVAAFRYGIGPDYFTYSTLYYSYEATDPLYDAISQTLSTIGLDFKIFSALISALNLVFVYLLASRYSKRPTLTLLLYYSMFYHIWTLSGLRQGLALTAGFYILIWFINANKTIRSKILFIIGITMASMLHASAIILAIYYLFSNFIKINHKTIAIATVLIIIALAVQIAGLSIIFESIPLLSRVIPYIPEGLNISPGEIIYKTIPRLLFLGGGIYLLKSSIVSKKSDKILVKIFIFGMLIYLPIMTMPIVAARLSIYGLYSLILILPLVLDHSHKIVLSKKIKGIKVKILLFIFIIFFCSLYTYKNIVSIVYDSKIEKKDGSPVHIYDSYVNIYNSQNYTFLHRNYEKSQP